MVTRLPEEKERICVVKAVRHVRRSVWILTGRMPHPTACLVLQGTQKLVIVLRVDGEDDDVPDDCDHCERAVI
jgi:hypothetical protein